VRALNALLTRLQDAHTAQRKFLQDAAHQLRTPLAGLQVQIELLRSQQTDQTVAANLRQSVKRVTRLANQLLALARAEGAHYLMANASSVDLAKLIDEMLDDWLRIADEKKIDFGMQRDISTHGRRSDAAPGTDRQSGRQRTQIHARRRTGHPALRTRR
jgi:two-component system sensor histidine kinase TctE